MFRFFRHGLFRCGEPGALVFGCVATDDDAAEVFGCGLRDFRNVRFRGIKQTAMFHNVLNFHLLARCFYFGVDSLLPLRGFLVYSGEWRAFTSIACPIASEFHERFISVHDYRAAPPLLCMTFIACSVNAIGYK